MQRINANTRSDGKCWCTVNNLEGDIEKRVFECTCKNKCIVFNFKENLYICWYWNKINTNIINYNKKNIQLINWWHKFSICILSLFWRIYKSFKSSFPAFTTVEVILNWVVYFVKINITFKGILMSYYRT